MTAREPAGFIPENTYDEEAGVPVGDSCVENGCANQTLPEFDRSTPWSGWDNFHDENPMASEVCVQGNDRDHNTDPFVATDRFLEVFLRASHAPPGPLDKQMQLMSLAVADADFSSVFFTSTPIAAALTKKPFQALVGLLVVATVFLLTMRIFEDGLVAGRHFRFSALQLRNGVEQEITHPGIARFGLIRTCTRCPQEHVIVKGPNMTITYNETVGGPGWWFTTSDQDPALDPVRFLLLSSEDGVSWTEAGASGWHYESDGLLHLSPDTKWPTPMKRGQETTVVISVPEHWQLMSVGTYAVAAPMFLALWLASFVKQEMLGKWILLGGLGIMSSLTLASAIMIDDRRERLLLWTSFLGLFAVCVLIGWWERYLVVGLLGLGSGFVCIGITLFTSGVDGIFALIFWLLTGGVLILFCATLLYLRSLTLSASYEALAPDHLAYDEIWAELRGSPQRELELRRLQRVGRELFRALPDGEARQKHSPQTLLPPAPCTLASPPPDSPPPRTSIPRRLSSRLLDRRPEHEPSAPLPAAASLCKPPASAAAALAFPRTSSRDSGVESVNFVPLSRSPSAALLQSASFVPRRTTSLDQLYAQATGLQPIFQRKVAAWAGCARGLLRYRAPYARVEELVGGAEAELQPAFFPLLEDDEQGASAEGRGRLGAREEEEEVRGFVRWGAVAEREELREGVRWARLKGTERAIEKALRSYGGDVSRLLDLCRETIVFEKVEDLVECVQAILLDWDVRLARFKNRLDEAYDAKASAGFRNVCINVTLCSHDALTLGLEQHICEVQLLLLPFALMAKREGHKRYVQYRNARAE